MILSLRGKLLRGDFMKEKRNRKPLILPLGSEGLTTFPGPILTDPFGSYTGVTRDDEQPVQDADDL